MSYISRAWLLLKLNNKACVTSHLQNENKGVLALQMHIEIFCINRLLHNTVASVPAISPRDALSDGPHLL